MEAAGQPVAQICKKVKISLATMARWRSQFRGMGDAEVEQLKAAALPLVTQLSDDQKSTVLVIANMAGLGSVVTDLFSGNDVASNNN